MQRSSILCIVTQLAVGACVQKGDVLTPGDSLDAGSTLAWETAVAQVSANFEHSCALGDGEIHCWGDNEFGQLGLSVMGGRFLPTPLELVGSQSVETGERHSCALSDQGQVHCWGDGERGQLGQGTRTGSSLPVQVILDGRATAISSGFHHTCALLDDAELWCWGDNNEGQLGQGDEFRGDASRESDALLPVRVSHGASAGATGGWKFVDVGEGHTCGVQTDDSLWCWGRNSEGQLGAITDAEQHRAPLLITTGPRWSLVDVAQNYTCALDRDGALWCWGHNQGFRSGAGNPFGVEVIDLFEPTLVGDRPWVDFSTNMFHSCGLDASAELWCWGATDNGQLGRPGGDVQLVPERVAVGVARASTGQFSTCFVALDGSLHCAGKNDKGQLGVSISAYETSFERVQLAPRRADAEGCGAAPAACLRPNAPRDLVREPDPCGCPAP